MRLTKRTVDAAKTEGFVWDGELRGFGLRVTADGYKSFVVQYRTNGRQRRRVLGSAAELAPDEARKRARALLADVAAGKDPAEQRDAEREAPTVKQLAEEYQKGPGADKRANSVRNDQTILDRNILPALGSLKVADVTRRDIERLHRSMKDTPYQANRMLALLSRLFSVAVSWRYRPDNPAKGIERNPEEKRTRWLSAEELDRLHAALLQAIQRADEREQAAQKKEPGKPHRQARELRNAANAVRLMILTGCRPGEALRARWEQFDLSRGIWAKPGHTTKQRKDHHAPLNAPAVALLRSLSEKASGPWVFPGETDGPLTTIKTWWRTLTKDAKLPALRLHDLRHTYASHLVSMGIPLHTVGGLLGHSSPVTTHRYAHLSQDALRTATEAFGAVVSNRPALPLADPSKNGGPKVE